ncbi:MAG: AraC family transcriptional regulator [Mongoliibacter sp.]|uniref:helix-turn-helix domain-containing protein n=1 Tax=Mongoliibacter sp. TaxID=2022438 RepID=UPI0012F0E23E|nr:helix-turn-helix domain-containing protein [Mongoliibacter sp.]TVP51600.1 MAG: AraC family transcriptional regulator [Mongoliibacter sp.]
MQEKVCIIQALEKPEVFRQNHLNIYEFSKLVKIPQRTIANFISEQFGKGFHQVVQDLRLKAAIEEINKNPGNIIFGQLAKNSGFSSRTTFFRIFKNKIGTCPSEYLRQRLKTKSE